MCVICRNEYHGLKEIGCGGCTNLTQIPVIPGLKELYCSYTNLPTIPNIPGLKRLWCSYCTNLTTIPNIPGLKKIDCRYCTNLTTIPNIPGLKKIDCRGCTSLTQLPVIPGLEELDCMGCPWVEQQNLNFRHNLYCLIKLQRYFKKRHKIRILRRWMNTEEFAMWYYHPENPGGLRQKAKMRKMFGEIEGKLKL